jgi:hypothetical protein
MPNTNNNNRSPTSQKIAPSDFHFFSFNQKNMLVEHISTRSAGVATRAVLGNLCSEVVKSERTKVAGIISGQ